MGQITLLGSYLLDYTLLGFVTQTLILSNLFRFSSVQIDQSQSGEGMFTVVVVRLFISCLVFQ